MITPHHSDALSVDVEDYFQVEAFADHISPDDWPNFPSRVRRNCERILALFAKRGLRATFFVLGWVAEHYPDLVREIAEAGHEVGCHGYSHRRVTSFSPKEFREDLRRARATIQGAADVPVVGYRAPTFSIVQRSLWALEVLAEEGFEYDSSIFPIRHDLYGYPEFPRFMQQVSLPSGRTIIEVPMSTVRVSGINWPVGGGGYLRLLPMTYTRWAIKKVHEDKKPIVIYMHPWEIDPEQPRLNGSWKSKLRHYVGLSRMEKRLDQILQAGRFAPLGDLVASLGHRAPIFRVPEPS